MNKKIIAVITTIMICFIALVIFPIVENASSEYLDINEDFEKFLNQPVSSETSFLIEQWEEELNSIGPFGKMFIKRKDEIERVKEENEKYIEKTAQEISNKIKTYKSPKKLKSYSEYCKYQAQIDQMSITENSVFWLEVKSRVKNYYLVDKYAEQLKKLYEFYRIKCSKCSGRGSYRCDYCNGSGKCLVTWYDYGDWGDKSYTTYECTRCNNGRKSCSACDNGYITYWRAK